MTLTLADVEAAFSGHGPLVDFTGAAIADRDVVSAIAAELERDTECKELKLTGCGMGFGLPLILIALTISPTSCLRVLGLRQNLLGPLRQCGYIGQFLAENAVLERLDVSRNQLGEDPRGFVSMLTLAKGNPRSGLSFIDAGDNELQALPPGPVEAALLACPRLFLNLNGNPATRDPEMSGVSQLLKARHKELSAMLQKSRAQAQAQEAAGLTPSGAGGQTPPPRRSSLHQTGPANPSPKRVAFDAERSTPSQQSTVADRGPQQAPDPSPQPSAPSTAPATPSSRTSPVCDSCREPIIDYQYRCMTCPRYRLCTKCYKRHERKALHDPEHNFIVRDAPSLSVMSNP